VDVFVVEDQRQMQSVLTDLLQSLGDFRIVGSATTEAEALAWLDQHEGSWRLAIIDLVLDQGTGINVIGRARLRGQKAASVAVLSGMSARDPPPLPETGRRRGFPERRDMGEFIAFCADLNGAPA
jgi:DNA-binding NarL/FixJ family response regulator